MNTSDLRDGDRRTAAQIITDHADWLKGVGGQRLVWHELPEAEHAGLRDTELRNADLRNADLARADLRYANLRNADLAGAILAGADLRYADLRYANLAGADLARANLRNADLPMTFAILGTRSDKYQHFADFDGEKIMVRAGCRYFAIDAARAHWNDHPRGQDCKLCAESLAFCDLAEAIGKIRGWGAA